MNLLPEAVDYTDKDFDALRTRLIQLVKSVFPDWTDFEVASFGNVLIESDGQGNSQIIHYGGDNGDTDTYRKGTLHLHHNTVFSTRTGNTTLARLSTADETADVRNNVVHVTAAGHHLAMLNGEGTMLLSHNWLTAGWADSHSGGGAVVDDGAQLTGGDPGFRDAAGQDFAPLADSPLVDASGPSHPDVAPPDMAYLVHRRMQPRPVAGRSLDLGAFEAHPVGDLNGDGLVDGRDLAALLAGWGLCPSPPAFCTDLDQDGAVEPADLAVIIAQWDSAG